jgi:hypothetical protein
MRERNVRHVDGPAESSPMSSESRAESEREPEVEGEPKPGSEPNSEPGSESEAESVPEPRSEADSETASAPESQTASKAEPEAEPKAEAETGADSEPEADGELESSSESGAESGAKPASESDAPVYADRCYRSPGALAGGVLMLLLGFWLGGDALTAGTDRTRLLAVAGLVFAIPLVIAYTLRPAVYASAQRMLVRNPFRTITIPWGTVESVQSGYSSEVIADGTKYQLWSIPVSLRARNRAARQTERAERGESRTSGLGRPTGMFGMGGAPGGADDVSAKRAPSDQAIDELRRLVIDNGESPAAQGEVTVRWAYAIAVPALVGAVALAVLMATG